MKQKYWKHGPKKSDLNSNNPRLSTYKISYGLKQKLAEGIISGVGRERSALLTSAINVEFCKAEKLMINKTNLQ